MTNSIVTIQLGNYANFIGSHYWNLHEYAFDNIQESPIDPDVHYSEGQTANNKTTYTPRLISMDWKENLGANIIDNIYEDIENEEKQNSESRRDINSLKIHSYSGKVDMHTGFSKKELSVNEKDTILPQSDYNYWNEYLYSRFHPRSLNSLPKLHRGFNRDNFQAFSQGLELSNSREFRENMEEQTRYFVEKCDSLQGFQLICDSDNGFSGVASTWLDHLKDEYRQPVLSIPVSHDKRKGCTETLFNEISLLSQFNSSSVATLPLSLTDSKGTSRTFPNIDYDHKSQYSSSAIIALSLKSLLLPCVSKQKLYTLSDFNSVVAGSSNTLVSLALSLPFPIKEGSSLCSSLSSSSVDSVFTSLSPLSNSITNANVHSIIGNIYGFANSRVLSTIDKSHSLFKHCSTAADSMEIFLGNGLQTSNVRFFSQVAPVRLAEPFPRIFTGCIDRLSGETLSSNVANGNCRPKTVPLASMMFSADCESALMPLYTVAMEALRRNQLSDVISVTERDSLTDVLENFRNII